VRCCDGRCELSWMKRPGGGYRACQFRRLFKAEKRSVLERCRAADGLQPNRPQDHNWLCPMAGIGSRAIRAADGPSKLRVEPGQRLDDIRTVARMLQQPGSSRNATTQ